MESVCYIVGAAPLDGRLPQTRAGDLLIAADAGITALTAAGVTPDLVIGDFDSLGAPPEHPNVITHSPIKDDTDTILAIRYALSRGYRRFELYGALGGKRLDLTVASFQTLLFLRSHGARGMLIGDGWNVTVLDAGTLRFPPGTEGRLAVFCAGEPCTGVTIRGARYAMTDGEITTAFPIGVSNALLGQSAEITVKNGMLYVLWQGDARPEEVPL